MRVLVIGGTYFLGKVFVDMVKDEHELTLLNRGSMPAPEGVKTIICDRHDVEALRNVYDVIVDFAAYQPGDIRGIVEAIPGDVKGMRYIFISTTDVYARGTGKELDEDAPFETRDFGGEAGAYILGKVALEKELTEISREKGIIPTSVRPAFIYGEGSYAPRESMYFKWIANASQFLHVSDADGFFQMVYVRDVARAIMALLERNDIEAVNPVGDGILTYDRLAEVLIGISGECLGVKAERIDITVREAEERGIPFPYPMTKAESNMYVSKYPDIIEYTDFYKGLRDTFAYHLHM